MEKRPVGHLGPDVETLSARAGEWNLSKGPESDTGSFGAKAGCEQSRP